MTFLLASSPSSSMWTGGKRIYYFKILCQLSTIEKKENVSKGREKIL